MVVNNVQLLNARLSIVVTVSGIVTDINPEQKPNASWPITVNCEVGVNVRLVSPVQLLNAKLKYVC